MSKPSLPQETQWPDGAIFTLGHSTLPLEEFTALLQTYGIDCLADIRPVPRSRHNPPFNGAELGPTRQPDNTEYASLPARPALRPGP